MSREAIRMKLTLDPDAAPPAAADIPAGYTLAPIRQPHVVVAELAEVATVAYRGTVDEHPAGADGREIGRTFAGEYGPFDPHASAVATASDGSIAAAVLIIHYDGRPLLANVFTGPEHRGRGLGAALIGASARALRAAGHTELVLVVTQGNPAARLYRKLGFVDWPREEGAGS
jgi:GNAT superfamily N-acetyltransferase